MRRVFTPAPVVTLVGKWPDAICSWYSGGLLPLLAVRETIGHALSGDRAAAISAVAEARR